MSTFLQRQTKNSTFKKKKRLISQNSFALLFVNNQYIKNYMKKVALFVFILTIKKETNN
jgi:hypothetical protein